MHCVKQQWAYFSEMKHDEVVLIKGFDSEKEGFARFTPHTAFEYTEQDPNVGARVSKYVHLRFIK